MAVLVFASPCNPELSSCHTETNVSIITTWFTVDALPPKCLSVAVVCISAERRVATGHWWPSASLLALSLALQIHNICTKIPAGMCMTYSIVITNLWQGVGVGWGILGSSSPLWWSPVHPILELTSQVVCFSVGASFTNPFCARLVIKGLLWLLLRFTLVSLCSVSCSAWASSS